MMKNRLQQIGRTMVALVLVVLLVQAHPAQATQQTQEASQVDISQFSLEITAQDVSYTTVYSTSAYTLRMQADGTEGFLYGFYRQSFDWSGQAGVALSLSNESEAVLYLGLQLMDANWQSVALPDQTPVFLQEAGQSYYTLAYISQGVVAVPAGFTGQVYFPLLAQDEVLCALQGVGLTFVPQGVAVCNITGLALWGAQAIAQYQEANAVSLQLAEDALVIPQVGQSMTYATVAGLSSTEGVVYTLLDAPSGTSIDAQGCIWIDPTAQSGVLTVQAVAEGQLALQAQLYLFSAQEVMPDETSLDQFAVLAPADSTLPQYLQPFLWAAARLPALRLTCVVVALALVGVYALWRRTGVKKR